MTATRFPHHPLRVNVLYDVGPVIKTNAITAMFLIIDDGSSPFAKRCGRFLLSYNSVIVLKFPARHAFLQSSSVARLEYYSHGGCTKSRGYPESTRGRIPASWIDIVQPSP